MILEAILKINPNAICTVKNDDIDNIEWHEGTTPIPKSDIEEKIAELEADYNS